MRCQTLRLPRPTALVSGNGSEDTIFLQLPDSVYKPHLAPKCDPVAKVSITGVAIPAIAIETQLARICPLNAQWKWEIIAHDATSFLVNFPSF
jgi:hypothetical protein